MQAPRAELRRQEPTRAERLRSEPSSAERSIPGRARRRAGLGVQPGLWEASPPVPLSSPPSFSPYSPSLAPFPPFPLPPQTRLLPVLSLARYSLLFPLSPSSAQPPCTLVPGFPFPSRFPAQPELPRRPFSCPALAPLFPCPLSFFAPQPRGSGCRRIKPRGPEPGAPGPLQESPRGAGGSRRIPPCRSSSPADSAGAAALPASR
ncbi:uncharacterized protein LOC118701102 isoform X1 [Molothrus ater]|uniref:uncharacterized protein LOC118701102 isoform X1 n=1 Tax=Molothrus ater TaxID=84834 RepID=UPI0023E8C02B|nr:uncharacterized protein LOC118701102 isoform X1 [Molothrus ater]XP_054374263.1 uncharacterized protein LOC118701102 isoform X1 [Molothrus ater]